jgi:hypothetical protein
MFFHFFQPSLVSSLPLSQYKKDLIATMPEETRCGIDVFTKGYVLYKRNYLFNQEQISGADLTDIFMIASDQNEYFWDHIHVSSPANKIISRAIFDTLGFKVNN